MRFFLGTRIGPDLKFIFIRLTPRTHINMSPITGFTDTPITNDQQDTLEIKHYLESLAAFIQKCETPMTISIQGEWGTGKTSSMNIIRSSLEKSGIPTAWFNTWQFSQFSMQDYLPLSMLSCLADVLESPPEVRATLSKAWALGSGLAMTALRGTAMMAMEKAVGGSVTGMVFGTGDNQDNNQISPLTLANDVRKLKENLAIGVRRRLQKEACDRLVVFIDDLDRLDPKRAVELLEVMKNFLDVPGCVFILAVDHEVVEQGIKSKFGLQRLDRKGKSFFDKIIQLSFNLPVAHYNTRRYVQELISQMGIRLERPEEDADQFIRLISSSVGFNPRGMKRVFNLFQLLGTVRLSACSLEARTGKEQVLFGLLCAQVVYPELYQHLVSQRESMSSDTLHRLARAEAETEYPVNCSDDPDVDPEDRVEEMSSFMEVFINVLDCDGDDDISPSELDVLRDLLSFSAITSHSDPVSASGKNKRTKLSSYEDLYRVMETQGRKRGTALLVSEAMDRALKEHSKTHQKPYRRTITGNGVITYSVEGMKGKKPAVFVYSYLQAGGLAVHIDSQRLTLKDPADLVPAVLEAAFKRYDQITLGDGDA